MTTVNGNHVFSETINEYSILLAAPGANVRNTKVHTDRGAVDGQSTVFVEVGEPDIDKAFLGDADFVFKSSFEIPAQYDVGSLEATVKDGIIFIQVTASEDRIAQIPLTEI